MNIKAIWNNQILAESNETIQLEGNHYFPSGSVNKEFFENSDLHTICPYKGQASYHSIVVDGKKNEDAAWYYPNPKKQFEKITDSIAFWRGVQIVEG